MRKELWGRVLVGYNRPVKKLLFILPLSVALLGFIAMNSDGEYKLGSSGPVKAFSGERVPTSLPQTEHKIAGPTSGEPSDNGLTQSMHREFRDALNRDPLSAIELAKDYVFTRELDPNFRLEILRELKALQFSQPGVAILADEIISLKPNPELFEEALAIKYATMNEEEFSALVADLASEIDDPEYVSLIEKQFGSKVELNLSAPLSHTDEETANTALEPEEATASG